MNGPDPAGTLFQRLLPEPATLTAAEAVAAVRPELGALDDRPYVVVNMVSTLDGRATLAGRAGPIGNRADRELFRQLRTRTDAVLVGAGTARVEHYRRLVRDPALRAQREEEGLAPDPLACIVSGRLDLPLEDVPLLQDPYSTVVVITASDGEIEGAAAQLHYLRTGGAPLDLGAMLAELRARFGVRSILCEGGPTLNATLLAADLVDELFLSLAPKLTGGMDPLTIVEGSRPPSQVDLELSWVLESEGHLFLRYIVPRPARPATT